MKGNWNEPDGSTVGFGVDQSGVDYYTHVATNGTFEFTVNYTGPVDFGPYPEYSNSCTSAPVQGAIHWTSPILWQLSGPD